MKNSKKIILALACLSMGLAIAINSSPVQSQPRQLSYQTLQEEQYTLHTVTIPRDSDYLVSPVISGNLQPITDFAQEHNLLAAINGGYFDPVNQKTTSMIVKRSQIVADPHLNERLVDNPDLKPYLNQIFNRAEFRRYLCAGTTQYDIQLHSAPIPQGCTLVDALGGGPGLLPQNTAETEAFLTYKQGQKIRDAIGNDSLNARSAVGITKDGNVILAMVAQQSNQPGSGISIPQLGSALAKLGAVKAMNLDGGSSASLYYDNQAIYGKIDQKGREVIRPIKSVLSVIKQP